MSPYRKNQRERIVASIGNYTAQHGFPPTLDEIGEDVGLCKSNVHRYVKDLENRGDITRTARRSRGLRLVKRPPVAFAIPVEGYIAAGKPIEFVRDGQREVELTTGLADPTADLFALQVKGDSMIGELVSDGDIAVVDRRAEPRQGQMAVVYLRNSNEATLKHVFLDGDRVRLQPAHPFMPAFYARAEDVEIQGSVVAIIRRLA